jgi:hypothetical protein
MEWKHKFLWNYGGRWGGVWKALQSLYTSIAVLVQPVALSQLAERKNSCMSNTDLFKPTTLNAFCDNSTINFVNPA